MALTLTRLTDAELIRHVDNTLDPLTSTDLEAELLRRFTKLVDTAGPILAACDDEHPLHGCLPTLLGLLDEFEVSTPDDLRARLKLRDDFRALADEAGDVFQRIATLASTN